MGQDNHNGGIPGQRDEPSGPNDRSGNVPGPPPVQPWGQPQAQPWGQPSPPPNPWEQQNQPWGTPGIPPQNQPWGTPGIPPQGGPWGQWAPPPKPGVIPLRPLGLGELLDGAFQACRRNAAATFGAALLVQAFVAVLTLILFNNVLSPALLDEDFGAAGTSVGPALTSGTLVTVVSVVGVLLLQGMLVVPVARSILNLKTGFTQTWKLSGRRLLPLAGLGVLLTVILIAGLVAFAFALVLIVDTLGVAGIGVVLLGVLALAAVAAWLGVKLALAPAALVLEPAGVFASLRRSWQLTRRNFWRSFGILALTVLLVTIVSSVISTPVGLLLSLVGTFGSGGEPGPAATLALVALNVAVTAFFSAIGYAFQAAVTSLLYVDLRIRREGFDITLMKEQELVGSGDADLVPGRARDTGR
ncbi:glycerophosphoryl diester phosphodiesterase membrane domain-containing protein [Arthrobacter sp. ATA002]|uniref:proline-rich domain-containing protein n=1 Tax=Arthrobacter sp. ATA002 TaxID=2991715 RepID=UPI0022A65DA1|nr:glycerophosphoryl diester phosphodiesterase membrane domain-containing protein [Arthrobacter sp. ATA002]WAP52729.1 glycerophosphoryl diester phosphodiesterase membrane domain-containing protein [Arthrobacter sp. ATA002]